MRESEPTTVRVRHPVLSTFTDLLPRSPATGHPSSGMLFGRILSSRSLVVEYAIPHLPDDRLGAEYGRGYALGARDGARDAAWQLGDLIPVGLWVSYREGAPEGHDICGDLSRHWQTDPVLEPQVFLVATWVAAENPVLKAYARACGTAVAQWDPATVVAEFLTLRTFGAP